MHPSLDEVRRFSEEGDYKRVPVMIEMLSDGYTPIEVMRIIRNASNQCYPGPRSIRACSVSSRSTPRP